MASLGKSLWSAIIVASSWYYLILFLTVLESQAVAVDAHAAGQSDHTDDADCEADPIASYNMTFHIGGVFIVLAVSGAGMFASFCLGTCKKKQLLYRSLQMVKMFGIGVIAATAWIHLLPDAFSQFSNPCLQGYWTVYGINYVGLFGLIAAFVVQLIEVLAISNSKIRKECTDCEGHVHISDATEMTLPTNSSLEKEKRASAHSVTSLQKVTLHVSTLVLEAGILVHSVIIGLSLGVAADDEFYTLLIAVSFHQLFEGMALGSLLSAIHLSKCTKIVLASLYPLTTPIGVAIGIGIRNSFNTNSQNLIVTQGVLNSLSAGILMYSAYCQLIAGEINRSPTFAAFSQGMKICCFLSMYLGASAMAVLGLWA